VRQPALSMLKNIYILLFVTSLGVCFSQTVNSPLAYVVNKPKTITHKTPVLIILHGYGSRETDSRGMAKILDDNFIVFSLRAPHTATAGGFYWFKMDFLPWKNFKNDYKEAQESRVKIQSFISHACKAFGVDSTQVFVMGFSQGGMMAYDLALSAPKKIKGVLALNTRMMEETTIKDNVDWPAVQQLKFYIVGGYSDPVISFLDSYKAHDFLKTKGVQDVTAKFYDIQHTITGDEIKDMKVWLSGKLKIEN
jgi:phospholipase/carboxylesterase